MFLNSLGVETSGCDKSEAMKSAGAVSEQPLEALVNRLLVAVRLGDCSSYLDTCMLKCAGRFKNGFDGPAFRLLRHEGNPLQLALYLVLAQNEHSDWVFMFKPKRRHLSTWVGTFRRVPDT